MLKKVFYALNSNSGMEQKPFQKRKRMKSLIFILIGCMCTAGSVNAQLFGTGFNCKKDKLDVNTVKVPSEASNLVIGQQCTVTVLNSKGKNVTKDIRLSSDNEYARINGFNFSVEYKDSPWTHLDGSLMELDGNITVAAADCALSYSFPFKVRQAYTFDRNITCKGEKREFAVAKYKNELEKELIVVLDITQKQLYLLEAPVTIDASGVKGVDGSRGSSGKNGDGGTENSQNGGAGSPGSPGGNGGNGGDGGEITVYLPHNVDGITVNVNGGEGGRGGAGGKGGNGGNGYSRKTGEKGALGLPKYEKLGKDGPDGSDGRPGNDGRSGRNGNFNRVKVDDIQRYFLDVKEENFNLDNIDLE